MQFVIIVVTVSLSQQSQLSISHLLLATAATGATSLVATLDHCHTTGRYTDPLRSLHVVTCCINYGGAVMELLAM